jgi:hypothetical protein
VDKHQLVHPRFMVPTYFYVMPDDRIREVEYRFGPPYVLEDGAQLYAIRFVDDAEVIVPTHFNAEVCFGPPEYTRLNIYGLRNFGDRIVGIISNFRKVTPEFRS